MILWRIEHKSKEQKVNKIADKMSTQEANRQPQFQEGTYEKVQVMLKINKHKVPKGNKIASKNNIIQKKI